MPTAARPPGRTSLLRLAVPFALFAVGGATLAGCPAEEEPRPADGDDRPTRREEGRPVCLRGEPFVANGPIPVDAAGAEPARAQRAGAGPPRVADLRLESHTGCERLVIYLGLEDDRLATSSGEVEAELLRDLGVVRVSLFEVEGVDPEATDARLEGSLARAAYAVRAPEGRRVYVDLHLAAVAEAHVRLLEDPARVAVDLRPGGGPIPPPSTTDARVVVLAPRPGPATYPLGVTGYARTFEANVVARIERDGEEIAETFTTATAWADAWGHYEITFEEGPSGPIELHVGEYSARDGTWEGVAVPLELR